MKVLVLKANYFPVCGAGRLLETMLPHLDAKRVEPVLVEIATPGQPSSVHFVSPRTAHLQRHRIEWHGAKHSRSAIAALRDLIRTTGARGVYSHDMRCDLLCRLAGANRGLGVPWVAHVHGWVGRDGELRLRIFETIDRLCIRSANEVWVGSQCALRDVRRLLPTRVPLHCFENALDPATIGDAATRATQARIKLLLPKGAFAVGMHARLHLPKGHHLLAKAVLRCSHTNVHAVLLGYGDEEANLRKIAARPEAQGRIHVVGHQAPADTLATVAGLDMFVYASLRESLPLAVLEAMWLARPIVSSDVGDLSSVLEHGRAGILVQPHDVAAMACAIDVLAADPARRAALASRARELAVTRFAPQRLGIAITDAWQRLCGGPA